MVLMCMWYEKQNVDISITALFIVASIDLSSILNG